MNLINPCSICLVSAICQRPTTDRHFAFVSLGASETLQAASGDLKLRIVSLAAEPFHGYGNDGNEKY